MAGPSSKLTVDAIFLELDEDKSYKRCSACLSFAPKLLPLGINARIFQLITAELDKSIQDSLQQSSELVICTECFSIISKVRKLLECIWKGQNQLKQMYHGIAHSEAVDLRPIKLTSSTVQRHCACEECDVCGDVLVVEHTDIKVEVETCNDYQQQSDDEFYSDLKSLISNPLPEDEEDTAAPKQEINHQDPEELPFVEEMTTKRKKSRRRRTESKPKAKKKTKRKAAPVTKPVGKGGSPRNRRIKDFFNLHTMTEYDMLRARSKLTESPSYLKAAYKCVSCIKGFQSTVAYKTHMRKHEGKAGEKKCEVCTQYIASDILKYHIAEHYLRYDCKWCSYSANSVPKFIMWRHYAREHAADDYYKCDVCSAVLSSYQELYNHKKKHTQWKCEECKLSFVVKLNYNKHMELHKDKVDLLTCNVCKKKCKNKQILWYHQYYHSEREKQDHYCVECNTYFKTIDTYKAHLQMTVRHSSVEDRYECDHCGKVFRKRSLLARHIKLVHFPKRFQCIYCEKNYSQESYLKKHVSFTHEGQKRERQCICEVCGDSFYDKRILETHKRRHTGERPYACPDCGNTFAYKGALHTHRRLVHKVKTKKQILLEASGATAADTTDWMNQ